MIFKSLNTNSLKSVFAFVAILIILVAISSCDKENEPSDNSNNIQDSRLLGYWILDSMYTKNDTSTIFAKEHCDVLEQRDDSVLLSFFSWIEFKEEIVEDGICTYTSSIGSSGSSILYDTWSTKNDSVFLNDSRRASVGVEDDSIRYEVTANNLILTQIFYDEDNAENNDTFIEFYTKVQ